jgi:hypothetical protein
MSRVTVDKYGVVNNVASYAKLPANAYNGKVVYVDDLNSLWVYDQDLSVAAGTAIWLPVDGVIPFVYDVAVLGGAVGNINLAQYVPPGIIISKVEFDIVTSFSEALGSSTTTTTTTTSYSTLAISCQSAGDLMTATAISSLTAGQQAGVVIGATPGTWIKTTAARRLYVTVAGALPITAGKLYGFLSVRRSFTT